jgi:hypothetical protein
MWSQSSSSGIVKEDSASEGGIWILVQLSDPRSPVGALQWLQRLFFFQIPDFKVSTSIWD